MIAGKEIGDNNSYNSDISYTDFDLGVVLRIDELC